MYIQFSSLTINVSYQLASDHVDRVGGKGIDVQRRMRFLSLFSQYKGNREEKGKHLRSQILQVLFIFIEFAIMKIIL